MFVLITAVSPPPHRHCEYCSSWWESHNDLCVQFLPCLLWSAEGTLWATFWPLPFQLLTRCCFLSSMACLTVSTSAKAPDLHTNTGCVGTQTHSDAQRGTFYFVVFRKVKLRLNLSWSRVSWAFSEHLMGLFVYRHWTCNSSVLLLSSEGHFLSFYPALHHNHHNVGWWC